MQEVYIFFTVSQFTYISFSLIFFARVCLLKPIWFHTTNLSSFNWLIFLLIIFLVGIPSYYKIGLWFMQIEDCIFPYIPISSRRQQQSCVIDSIYFAWVAKFIDSDLLAANDCEWYSIWNFLGMITIQFRRLTLLYSLFRPFGSFQVQLGLYFICP